MCVAIVFGPIRQLFPDQNVFFNGGMLLPNLPQISKTNERGTRPKCKKHEETTALKKKQETHHLRFQMLAELSIGIL